MDIALKLKEKRYRSVMETLKPGGSNGTKTEKSEIVKEDKSQMY